MRFVSVVFFFVICVTAGCRSPGLFQYKEEAGGGSSVSSAFSVFSPSSIDMSEEGGLTARAMRMREGGRPSKIEHFVLDEVKALIDMLILVDSSQSMSHRLSDLGDSLGDIFTVIPDYDWQMAFSSVDHGDHDKPESGLQANWRSHTAAGQGRFGSLMLLEDGGGILRERILSPEIPRYESVFFHTLSRAESRNCNRPPYCHGRVEQPLRSLKSAMQRAFLDNSRFFRPSADFISLIITNEEERAEDRSRATSAEDVFETFNRSFGHLDKKFIAFNILVLDTDCLEKEKQSDVTTAHIGKSIARLADITGGANISICQSAYGSALKQISRKIKNSLENSVLLASTPIPESLKVEFDGPVLDWRLYGRQIVFERRNSHPVKLSVSYHTQQ